MKVSYRGFEIEAYREESMGAGPHLYYSIFRESDQYECTSGFTMGSDTIPDFINHMKALVDAELLEDDPWDERSGT